MFNSKMLCRGWIMLADCTDRKSNLRRKGVNSNAHNVELTKMYR